MSFEYDIPDQSFEQFEIAGLINLAWSAYREHDYGQALSIFEEAQGHYLANNDLVGFSCASSQFARIAREAERFPEAVKAHRVAMHGYTGSWQDTIEVIRSKDGDDSKLYESLYQHNEHTLAEYISLAETMGQDPDCGKQELQSLVDEISELGPLPLLLVPIGIKALIIAKSILGDRHRVSWNKHSRQARNLRQLLQVGGTMNNLGFSVLNKHTEKPLEQGTLGVWLGHLSVANM